jgi:hypothetical protein
MAKPQPKPKSKFWQADHGGGISTFLTDFIVSIVPDQFVYPPRWEPSQFLYFAVLADAAHQLNNPKERHFVLDWMNDEWPSDAPFSMCCDALGLEPSTVHAALLARAQGLPKPRALA